MAFSYRLMLRKLLECLGKSDERCEERDQSGQELPERSVCGGVPPLLRAPLVELRYS